MAEKKSRRPQGHYCRICGEYKANEKFSGKGHVAHICKSCSKLSAAEKSERMTLNKLENMFGGDISKEQRKWLENRLHDERPEVRETAKMVYSACFPYAERNNRKKQLLINTLEFEVNTEIYTEYGDEEEVHHIFTANRQTRLLTFHDCNAVVPDQSVTLGGGRMAKLLRWAVHSLEIFMWNEDYCSEPDEFDYDPYFPDWDEDDLEDVKPEEPAESIELNPSEITWRVQISYNNGEQQDTRCGDEYLPDRVEELHLRLLGYFEIEDDLG